MMFRRYEYLEGLTSLNDSNGKYLINTDGQIKNIKGNDLQYELDEEGHKVVYCLAWDGKRKYRVIDLVALQFKFLKLPLNKKGLVKAFVIDGDKQHTHASNVGYRFSEKIEVEGFSGFYYVPGYPQMAINELGEAINVKKTDKKKWYITKPQKESNSAGGYFMTSVWFSGQGAAILGRHRALCLTFKDYPDNVDKLTVNHKNGIPGHDTLNNLEWATRGQNNFHAYFNDLKTQHMRVLIRNVRNGEVTEYYSICEAGRQLGISDETMRSRLKESNFGKIYADGTQAKLKNDPRPWVEHANVDLEIQKAKLSLPIKVRNCLTNEVTEFKSVLKAAKATGVDSSAIGYRLKIDLNTPLGGYQFKAVSDQRPWNDFSQEEYLKSLKPHSQKVVARNLFSEEIRVYDSIAKAMIDLQKFTLSTDLKKGLQPLTADGWQVKREQDAWELIEDFEEKIYLLQKGVMALTPEGKILIGDSCKQLGSLLGLNGQTILKAAKSRGNVTYKGYRFRLGISSDDWPDTLLSTC